MKNVDKCTSTETKCPASVNNGAKRLGRKMHNTFIQMVQLDHEFMLFQLTLPWQFLYINNRFGIEPLFTIEKKKLWKKLHVASVKNNIPVIWLNDWSSQLYTTLHPLQNPCFWAIIPIDKCI